MSSINSVQSGFGIDDSSKKQNSFSSDSDEDFGAMLNEISGQINVVMGDESSTTASSSDSGITTSTTAAQAQGSTVDKFTALQLQLQNQLKLR